jgi:hypothetical protein
MSAGDTAVARPIGRDLVTIGACAAGLLLVRFVTEDIHVPGHSALPAMFFLVAAAKRVARTGAAVAVALPAALAAQVGFVGGAGGVASLLSLAALVEAARFLKPGFSASFGACAVVGLLAGAARFATQAVPLALGLPDNGAPALASVIGFATFGCLGAVLVPGIEAARAARGRCAPRLTPAGDPAGGSRRPAR